MTYLSVWLSEERPCEACRDQFGDEEPVRKECTWPPGMTDAMNVRSLLPLLITYHSLAGSSAGVSTPHARARDQIILFVNGRPMTWEQATRMPVSESTANPATPRNAARHTNLALTWTRHTSDDRQCEPRR